MMEKNINWGKVLPQFLALKKNLKNKRLVI